MGRHPKFDKQSITSAALTLVASGGPKAATVSAIADKLGAPTGSIYHRYSSRDRLLAELWMEVVEGYQNGFVAIVEAGDSGVDTAVEAALYMPRWVRRHLLEARMLLLHRREDFVTGDWPEELSRRAEGLKDQMIACLRHFAEQRLGGTSKAKLQRARFGLLDVPFGAVKPYVQAGKPPPRLIDELIEVTVRTVLA